MLSLAIVPQGLLDAPFFSSASHFFHTVPDIGCWQDADSCPIGKIPLSPISWFSHCPRHGMPTGSRFLKIKHNGAGLLGGRPVTDRCSSLWRCVADNLELSTLQLLYTSPPLTRPLKCQHPKSSKRLKMSEINIFTTRLQPVLPYQSSPHILDVSENSNDLKV